ncbi:hypothetical protein bcCo53_001699 (plasmid) [Borrelia coriaceae]|nr:hypothetical protein [Borrelia coriaceae]UPA17317.1 hypothetical protein bcCo53_001500 [Borrelia coriaceae]UPA17398.1 hypothetical protein bcCo53_001594 [Borrelia coriaceae]UPA17494.1 hypothetical protein bcCo53_001699 [Borrelia coriaceae]
MTNPLVSLLTLGVISCNITPISSQEHTLSYMQDHNLQDKKIDTSIYPKEDKKENTIQVKHEKLTQENIKSLQEFLIDSKDYYTNLNTIYNHYIQYIDQIMTYIQCNESSIDFCISNTNSTIRKEAIEKLNNSNLIKDFQTLAASLKNTNLEGFNNSIKNLKQVIHQTYLAKEQTTTNTLKTVKNTADAFITAINSSVTTYIDAFVNTVSNFNSNTFISAAHNFANAAKTLNKEVNIAALTPIIGTLRIMTFQLDNSIEQLKQYAINLDDYEYTGGTIFANAIDTLISAYKHATN